MCVSLEDADVVLLVVDWDEKIDENHLLQSLKHKRPSCWLLNKPKSKKPRDVELNQLLEKLFPKADCVPYQPRRAKVVDAFTSADQKILPNTRLLPKMNWPRSERFFASKWSAKNFFNYEQEIPYSWEVGHWIFKEEKL